jgi:MFS transporter, DHA2 family, methylenomycin A resistance protein
MGARRAFVSGFVVFSAASLGCALALSPAALIGARAVQGGGAALLVPCSLALLNNACGNDSGARARAIGIWTAAGAVAATAGPVLGGLLVGFIGWRSIFLVNLPIGLIGIWLTLRFVDQTERSPLRQGPDLAGQTLAILALLGLVGAIIEAGSLGWRASLVLVGLVLAILAGVGFIIVEAKTRAPAVPLELFRHSAFSAATIVGFAVNVTVYGSMFAFALYFQRVLLFSPIETGLAFLPIALTMTIANLLAGRIAARFGLRLPIIGGLLVGTAGCALLSDLDKETTYAAMLPGQLLIRVGIGLVVPPMTTAVLSSVHHSRSGIASGLLNAVRQTGGAVGVAVFGALMATDMVRGVRIALVGCAGLLVAAAIIAVAGIQSEGTSPRH